MLPAIGDGKMGGAVPAGLVLLGAPTVVHLAVSQRTRLSVRGLGELLNKHRCVVIDADVAKEQHKDPCPEGDLQQERTGVGSSLVPCCWEQQRRLQRQLTDPGKDASCSLLPPGRTSFGPCDLVNPCETSTEGSR